MKGFISGIKTAFLLSSTGNPREFIERRGRILRKSEGKEISTIIDFVTLPTEDLSQFKEENLWVERAILRREFFRLNYFAKWAENKHEASFQSMTSDLEGEHMRPFTVVVIEEVKSGDWGVGGKALSPADVKALAGGK